MVRTGLELDPRSRPGTILPGYGTNPLEVGLGRIKQEQVAGLQADKIAADKAKADKAASIAAAPEFDMAFAPHTNEFLEQTKAFTENNAAALQKYRQTGDPNDDPNDPSSKAFIEIEASKRAIKQGLAISKQDQADWTAFTKEYDSNPGKYTPEDFQLLQAYHAASPSLKASGEITKPQIQGYWDKTKYITDTLAPISENTWENSVYDPTLDMFVDTGGGGITEDTIKKQAFATSAEGTQAGARYKSQVATLPQVEQQRIMAAAQKEGVTPAQYKAFEDMKGLAYSKYTESKKKAGIQESMYGSGFKTREMEAKRPVDVMQGFANRDLSVFDAKPIRINSFMKPGSKMAYSSGVLQDYVIDQEKVMIGDKVYDVPYRIEEIEVEPNGDYTFIQRPDLVEYDLSDKPKITENLQAAEKRVTKSPDEAATYLWRKFPQFNKNVSEAEMTKYLESIGGTYDKTGKVRFNATGSNYDDLTPGSAELDDL